MLNVFSPPRRERHENGITTIFVNMFSTSHWTQGMCEPFPAFFAFFQYIIRQLISIFAAGHMNQLAVLMMFCSLTACVSQPQSIHVQKKPDILTIYEDGKMVFKDRLVNLDNVVIYPDGFGGERAAIKLRMPSKPDFYRDSILVRRIDAHFE